jgi:DNA adenine methylase
MKTLLKYPGAKNRLAPWIVSHIPPHKVYCEPFLGSGAVFLNKEPAYNEILNDLDDDIYNFFKVVRENPKELCRLIEATPYSRTEYTTVYVESEEEALSIERARRFAVKCWQGFGCGNKYKNGYRRGIGTTSPNPAKAWAGLPKTMQLAAERLKNAQIEHKDALELIKDMYGKDTFIYIDPPYLQDTRKKYLYNHEMTDEQHMKLLKIAKESSCKIMISAYENELYNTELIGWRKEHKSTTVECSRRRIETLYMNY